MPRMSDFTDQMAKAAGQRGALAAIVHALDAETIAQFNDADWQAAADLAQALLQAGAFAQVLELQTALGPYLHNAKQAFVAIAATASTAAANLGLINQAITSLENAAHHLSSTSPPETAEQVLASLGRLYKQRGGDQTEAMLQHSDFSLALNCYEQAYARSGGVWSGVNVATLKLLLGDDVGARAHAIQLRAKLDAKTVNRPAHVTAHADHYRAVAFNAELQWQQASLGEIAQILNQFTIAKEHYANAAAMAQAHHRFADLASMRRQLRLILRAQDQSLEVLDEYLPTTKLMVFSGHRLDEHAGNQNTNAARFAPHQLAAVRASIDAVLKAPSIRIAYTALSEGADVLFAQAAIAHGLELNVVLSTDAEGLAQEWLNLGLGSFDAVIPDILAAASKVYALAPEGLIGEALDYRYANEILLGSALLRANECDATVCGLALWDGHTARGAGGTASMVELMQARMPLQVIDLPGAHDTHMSRASHAQNDLHTDGRKQTANDARPAIKVLLFADFVGFSKLSSKQTAEFVTRALPLVAQYIAQFESKGFEINTRNTWGDGLFLVFDQALAAAEFALGLQALLEKSQADFSFPLKLRIALHCAPVMLCIDPISQRPNVFGPNVSRAARLEPATAPGAVYASEAFAAQIKLVNAPDSPRCSYLAHLPWAKGYGSFPTYIVQR
jgi:class 3 adenylate cyclase